MAEQTITPWAVEAKTDDGKMATINYDHVITQFGCQELTNGHIKAFEDLTGGLAHRFLRRSLAFAHRDFEKVLDCVRKGEKFFLYTGRGPSSQSMHIGHSVPFVFCKYMQDTFKIPFVIQITDDEKFLCKDITLEQSVEFGKENIKDIIAFGFDPNLTYIFSDVESSYLFLENTLKISKSISLGEAIKVFGFDTNTNIGMVAFPSKEIAAAFSSSFSFLKKKMQCLIPCAVDQDPYFRLARDKSSVLGERKPASIYLRLLPDLQGTNRKMSASDPKSSIYLSDTPNQIRKKIKSYAFSGGQETLELHRRLGGNTEVDIAYQYMRYFLEDDQELERLRVGYEKGEILSGEMKNACISCIQDFVRSYQNKRSEITDEAIARFKDINKFKDLSDNDLFVFSNNLSFQ